MIRRKVMGFLAEQGISGALSFAYLFYGILFVTLGVLFYIFIYRDYISLKKSKISYTSSDALYFLKILVFGFIITIIFVMFWI